MLPSKVTGGKMANVDNIYKICGACGGDGKIEQTHDGQSVEADCTNCN